MERKFAIILFLYTLISCENINMTNPVPSVPVSYTLNITREYPGFVIESGYQTLVITKSIYEREYLGYAGLLIWIGMDGNYHAADLCCPHCLKKNKPVAIDGLYAVCPICSESFDLSFGFANPTNGFTKYPLRKYNTRFNNSASGYSLRITN